MDKWEYIFVDMNEYINRNRIERGQEFELPAKVTPIGQDEELDKLNEMGLEGWEVANYIKRKNFYLMKRKIK